MINLGMLDNDVVLPYTKCFYHFILNFFRKYAYIFQRCLFFFCIKTIWTIKSNLLHFVFYWLNEAVD